MNDYLVIFKVVVTAASRQDAVEEAKQLIQHDEFEAAEVTFAGEDRSRDFAIATGQPTADLEKGERR